MECGKDECSIDGFSTAGGIFQGDFSLVEIDNCLIELLAFYAFVSLAVEVLKFVIEFVWVGEHLPSSLTN